MHGFNHLIRKGRVGRSLREQKRRISLVHKAPEILMSSREFSEYSEEKRLSDSGRISLARFWAFVIDDYGNAISIIVIVRQMNNGRRHFFSIMDEKMLKKGSGNQTR